MARWEEVLGGDVGRRFKGLEEMLGAGALLGGDGAEMMVGCLEELVVKKRRRG